MDSCFALMLVCWLFVMSPNGSMGDEDILPPKTRKQMERVEDHFDLKDTKWVGKSVFFHHLKEGIKGNCSCEKILLLRILDAYHDIFSAMRSQTEGQAIDHELGGLQKTMDRMRNHYFSGNEKVLLHHLELLRSIKVEDPDIQRQAVKEYVMVYENATRASEPMPSALRTYLGMNKR